MGLSCSLRSVGAFCRSLSLLSSPPITMGVTTPQEEHNAVTYTLTAAPEQHAQASRGLHVTSAESQSGTNAELQQSPSTWRARRANCRAIFCKVVCSPSGWQQIVLCVLWWLFILALIITIFVILLPRALAAPIQSFINTLKRNLTVPQLKAVIVAAVALLPCTLFIPFFPFIWVAGEARHPAAALAAGGVGSVVTYIGSKLCCLLLFVLQWHSGHIWLVCTAGVQG